MRRSVLAVLAGAVAWSVVWVASARAVAVLIPGAIAPDGSAGAVWVNLLFLGLSVVYSVGAGYLTAAVARRTQLAHAAALGVLQLALGIYFEVSTWQLAPLWYHLSFLVLLLPGNVMGGLIRARSAAP